MNICIKYFVDFFYFLISKLSINILCFYFVEDSSLSSSIEIIYFSIREFNSMIFHFFIINKIREIKWKKKS